MPRSYVYADHKTDDTGAKVAPQKVISVGWNKVGYVQVATLRNGTDRTDDGIFVDVDRDQINDLIRKLRKARDQAYGADA